MGSPSIIDPILLSFGPAFESTRVTGGGAQVARRNEQLGFGRGLFVRARSRLPIRVLWVGESLSDRGPRCRGNRRPPVGREAHVAKLETARSSTGASRCQWPGGAAPTTTVVALVPATMQAISRNRCPVDDR
jgi:hypothetical protein